MFPNRALFWVLRVVPVGFFAVLAAVLGDLRVAIIAAVACVLLALLGWGATHDDT